MPLFLFQKEYPVGSAFPRERDLEFRLSPGSSNSSYSQSSQHTVPRTSAPTALSGVVNKASIQGLTEVWIRCDSMVAFPFQLLVKE